MSTIQLRSWNVNGIRACAKKGFFEWLEKEQADIVCLQEVKAQPEQLDSSFLEIGPYKSYWHPAEKKGYSGVAIYSRQTPDDLIEGLQIPEIDREGRVLIAKYSNFTLFNCYFPNSQRDHARLSYKIDFCKELGKTLANYAQPGLPVVVCGDFNIAHHEIDLRNPKTNKKTAGFLPEERQCMTELLSSGYIDTFRHFTQDPHHYTWWSYRPGVRDRNIGWRIDYFVTSQDMQSRLVSSTIYPHVMGSDHCPIGLEIKAQ